MRRRWAGARVAYVNPVDGGQWVLAQAENLTPQTLVQDLGMTLADAVPARDREPAAPLLTSPLWKQLPAVRRGAVVEVDGELFYHSPLAAAANLDWAERSLLR